MLFLILYSETCQNDQKTPHPVLMTQDYSETENYARSHSIDKSIKIYLELKPDLSQIWITRIVNLARCCFFFLCTWCLLCQNNCLNSPLTISQMTPQSAIAPWLKNTGRPVHLFSESSSLHQICDSLYDILCGRNIPHTHQIKSTCKRKIYWCLITGWRLK